MASLDRNPIYVAGFVGLLVIAQATALATQFVRGYRPFMQAPSRVPLSWDMFATAISRCDVAWDPPLSTAGPPIARLSDTGQRFEWDPVYDTLSDYLVTARIGCTHARNGTIVTMRCFTSAGQATHDAFRCP